MLVHSGPYSDALCEVALFSLNFDLGRSRVFLKTVMVAPVSTTKSIFVLFTLHVTKGAFLPGRQAEQILALSGLMLSCPTSLLCLHILVMGVGLGKTLFMFGCSVSVFDDLGVVWAPICIEGIGVRSSFPTAEQRACCWCCLRDSLGQVEVACVFVNRLGFDSNLDFDYFVAPGPVRTRPWLLDRS